MRGGAASASPHHSNATLAVTPAVVAPFARRVDCLDGIRCVYIFRFYRAQQSLLCLPTARVQNCTLALVWRRLNDSVSRRPVCSSRAAPNVSSH